MASHSFARRPFPPVLVVGAISAAATTGALLAMGRRLGAAGDPFAAIAAGLLHETARATWPLLLIGFVLHLAAVFAWSAAAAWCHRALGWGAWSAGIAAAMGSALLSWSVARATGAGLASVLALGDRIELALVFALALVVGIRIAFLRREAPDW